MSKQEDLKKFITNALKEDVGNGNHSAISCVSRQAKNRAELLVKQEGVIAGIELAEMIFHEVDSSVKIEKVLKD